MKVFVAGATGRLGQAVVTELRKAGHEVVAGARHPEKISQPDILIVEGINTLQLPANQQIYISDFFDFSIFVDAQPALIEKWYLERFESLLDTAFQDPSNYYYQYAIGDRKEAIKMAKEVWKNVNLKNLHEYILPTRSRADIILHKTKHHLIDEVFLRKY